MIEKEYSHIRKFIHPHNYLEVDLFFSSILFQDMIKPFYDKQALLHPKIITLCKNIIPFIEKKVIFQSNDYIQLNEEKMCPIYTPHIIFDKENTKIVLPIRFNEYARNDDPVQLIDSIIFSICALRYGSITDTLTEAYQIAESCAAQTLIDHGLKKVKMNHWRKRILDHFPHGLEN